MLALLGNHQACFIFKHLFLQHMPDDIRINLASDQTDGLRTLAQQTDALLLARSQTPELCKVKQARSREQYQRVNNGEDFCYYHRRYGKNARQCRPPSAFQGNEETTAPTSLKCLSGKRASRSPIESTVTGALNSLFHVYDKSSCCKFVDTGAEVSVFPATSRNRVTSRN